MLLGCPGVCCRLINGTGKAHDMSHAGDAPHELEWALAKRLVLPGAVEAVEEASVTVLAARLHKSCCRECGDRHGTVNSGHPGLHRQLGRMAGEVHGDWSRRGNEDPVGISFGKASNMKWMINGDLSQNGYGGKTTAERDITRATDQI